MPIPNDLHDSPSEAGLSDGQYCWLSAPGVAALSLLFLHGSGAARAFNGMLANVDNIPRHLWLRPPAGELIDEVMCCRERGGYLLTLHGGPAIRRAVERELHTAGFSAGKCHPFGEGVFAARTLSLLPEARGAAAVGLVLEAAGQVDALRAALDEPSAIPSLLED